MPTRRLEDRIRELCARALIEKAPNLESTLADLQVAIEEHTLKIADVTTAAMPEIMVERRNLD